MERRMDLIRKNKSISRRIIIRNFNNHTKIIITSKINEIIIATITTTTILIPITLGIKTTISSSIIKITIVIIISIINKSNTGIPVNSNKLKISNKLINPIRIIKDKIIKIIT